MAARLEAELSAAGLGYHYAVVWGSDQNRVWNLRRCARLRPTQSSPHRARAAGTK
jgi:hypothetical protein